MNPEKRQRMCKRLTKLCFADYTFKQAKHFAEHVIESRFEPTDPILSPHIAGLVVTYAKNFTESQGMGPLPAEYSDFTEPILKHTHDRMIQARHQLYAHRDVEAAQSFTYDDPVSAIPYEVKIRFSKKDGLSFHPLFPELNPDILQLAVRLCDYQSERLSKEIAALLPALTNGNKYEDGRHYIIGRDFP